MNHKQIQTLHTIFSDPIRANVAWTDVVSFLIALGAEISEGSGSRVRVYLNGVRAVFHRPHPDKEVDKGTIKSLRRFLTEAGLSDFKGKA
ncbi:MAG: hexulose-6-phosphate isomerase [Chloroflexi bacterium HGW-Chloroflexi-5]|jgi:hypothetical protein|nr:MAG: hexulose-6-phosphate isomerase [Chloroflexi bacterium HGW-Chloroflexi-5]